MFNLQKQPLMLCIHVYGGYREHLKVVLVLCIQFCYDKCYICAKSTENTHISWYLLIFSSSRLNGFGHLWKMYSDTLVTSDTHHVFVLSGLLNHDVTIVQGSELDDVLTSCCSWRIEEARGIWMLNSAITPSSPINFCHFSSVLCEIKALLVVLLVLMV